MTGSSGGGRMLENLLADSHLTTLEQLPGRVAERAAAAGLHGVLIYLCDLQQTVLRLLVGHGRDTGRAARPEPGQMRIDGTLPGRAFQCGRVVPVSRPDAVTYQWWVPLLNGTERLGVLRVTTMIDDERVHADLRNLATVVALLVANKSMTSDSRARLVRTRPMSVAAEMQWNLMPPQTFADHRVMISTILEPAYQLGGDAVDYAVDGDLVHLALFDAMGHDTSAGLTANLAMAACRNSRRQGADLVEAGGIIGTTLLEQFGDARYVTAVLAELETRTGVFRWVNHGHHVPVVIRGGRWTRELRCSPAPPLGIDPSLPATVCRTRLQPGDRLVLYTDGIVEARSPQGEEFGLDRFVDTLVRHHAAGLPVPETLRRLIRGVLDYRSGRLQDDATLLILEWHGPTPFAPGEAETLTGLPEH